MKKYCKHEIIFRLYETNFNIPEMQGSRILMKDLDAISKQIKYEDKYYNNLNSEEFEQFEEMKLRNFKYLIDCNNDCINNKIVKDIGRLD